MDETYRIDALGRLGDGLVHAPSQDIIAPFTLPNETVTGQIIDGQLTDIRIIEPTPSRIKPACRHFKRCGGCKFQHATDQLTQDWKSEQIARALQAHGIETTFRPPHNSPPYARRRTTLTARKTKSGVMLGYLAAQTNALIEIQDCPVLTPEIWEKRPIFEQLARFAVTRKSVAKLGITQCSNGLDIEIQASLEPDVATRQQIGLICETAKLARISWNGETLAQSDPPVVTFKSIKVAPPVGAFLQATRDGQEAIQDAVLEIIEGVNTVADLFSGCGTFSLPAAKRCEVSAYEGSSKMIEALENAWRAAPDLHALKAETRDLFRRPLLAQELDRFNAAIIDPPRAGAAAQIAEFAKSKIPLIAHVSCNPSTFARDAKTLIEAGFNLDWVKMVDQFKWSTHVELIGKFSR